MKKIKSAIAVLMTVIIALSLFVMPANAENETGDIKILSYNVAGLPDVNKLLGKPGADVKDNQKQLGKILNESGCDIIAVQEDFSYHNSLIKGMENYPYKTNTSGGIPSGDGLNIFSKTKIYNEERTAWDVAYGVIDHGADELAPKGILYCVIDMGNGVLVDFYDIHADAYGDEGSQNARREQFKQLAKVINERGTARPVIITGDFNTSLNFSPNCGLLEELITPCGLKDAWTEVHNNGDYVDYSYYKETYGPSWEDSWGTYDSVEKFYYRDGDGVTLTPTEFKYEEIFNADGATISDHASVFVKFTYEKTADFKENTETLKVAKFNPFERIFKFLKIVAVDLYKVFSNFDELVSFIKGA